jgi:CRISPR-associated endonuclease/helicase Cas3
MPVQPLPGAANLDDEAGQVASGALMLQNTINFRTFVAVATGFEPMDWQARLACGTDAIAARAETLQTGDECRSRLIDIPTGCGKTAGTVLAWLWNRVVLNIEGWPRRLVYCLPMRALVNQVVEKDFLPWMLRLNLAATQDNTPERAKVDALLGTLNDRVARQVRAPIRNGGHETPIGGFLFNLLPASATANFIWLAEYSPIVLMGGEELDECRRQWDLYPEKPAIVIGTQDMLLSRALNRGYGMSRYRWPMHFGLLNTDCLWVLDEVQLMSSGFTTSLQLQAWRSNLPLQRRPFENQLSNSQPTILATHSWWMSATSAEHWFKKSVAMASQAAALWRDRLTLDRQNEAQDLFRIPKVLSRCSVTMPESPDDSGTTKYACALAKHLAKPINRKGKGRAADTEESEDILALIICNTVERATAVYKALKDLKKNGSEDRLFDEDHLLLLHSRFRGYERANWRQKFEAFEKGEGQHSGARIIVATQVIEAGVDISASVLYTELCPLASLIQRLGRCARRAGETGQAFWIDFEVFESDGGDPSDRQIKCARPYDPGEIAATRRALINAAAPIDVSLGRALNSLIGRGNLADCQEVRDALPFDPRLIPQRRDLFNLFDTTPDLSGADIDISPFIRDGQDLDVLVFWRDNDSGLGSGEIWKSGPRAGCPFKKLLPARDELCAVPAWQFREFFKGLSSELRNRVWVRDWRKGWVKLTDPDRVYPGQMFLLHKDVGGYDPQVGWTGKPDSIPQPCSPLNAQVLQDGEPEEPAAFGDSGLDDEDNAVAEWQSVHKHSVRVATELDSILEDDEISSALENAGLRPPLGHAPPWHDLGKAHGKFFAKLTSEGRSQWSAPERADHPAKAPRAAWKSLFHDKEDAAETDRCLKRRPGFRHELASALGLLELLRLGCPEHPALAAAEELKAALGLAGENAVLENSGAAAAAVAQIAQLDRLSFNLLLFLVACHHGKVRLGLRSAEDDYNPDQRDPIPDASHIRRCQGVQDEDIIPSCRLPCPDAPSDPQRSVLTPALSLSLDAMELFSARYGASWSDRMFELLEVFGPFNMGYLEALLRAADQRASKDSRGM